MYVFKRTPGGNELVSSIETPAVTVSIESSETSLPELLQTFEDFLRGCGYTFDGHIEIVEDELDNVSLSGGGHYSNGDEYDESN